MVGTRRGTRRTTAAGPKHADSDSWPQKGASTARRKRARDAADQDQDQDQDEHAPPPKKKAAKQPQPPKAAAPATPASGSNRGADGKQDVFWLLKAEPLPRYQNGVNVAFSIDDLAACTVPEPWGGVRNPQARNNMQAMRKGDLAFFYHSNAKPSGVVGILRVADEAKVDETAFDHTDPYYDPKSNRENPKWYCVGVEFVKKFDQVVDLARIKSHAGSGGELEGMQLVTHSRLSVCRVRKEEWAFILHLAGEAEEAIQGTRNGPTTDQA
ncbi:hypothetical protein ACEQ8H_006752 [Pleosporales sp. CAS-2024a]